MNYKRFYFFCPDISFASGGVSVIYRLCNLLNKNNIESHIFHVNRNFKYLQEKHLPYLSYKYAEDAITFTEEDVIIIPEGEVELMYRIKGIKAKKVVFNQNWAYTYGGFNQTIKSLKAENKEQILSKYQDFGITDIMVVTDYIKDFLSYGMNNDNDLKFYKVSPYLDFNNFRPKTLNDKKLQIAIMPRKNYNNFEEVLWVTRSKGVSMNLIYINDMTEQQVAQIMSDSKIFVSLGYPEGFGLPPLEAMACGCIVIGYHGNAGLEYMNDKNMFIYPNGEILDFAKKLVEVYTDLRDNLNYEKYAMIANNGIETSQKFTIENTEKQLLEFVNTI